MHGFIGLGQMGGAIAHKLLRSGTELLVFDVDAAAVAPLREAGAIACSSVREVADRAGIVLTCLPVPAVSLDVAREVASGERVEMLAELSTIGRGTILEMERILAPANVRLVDAPVSGGPLGAECATLSLMLAGPSAACDRVAQVCAAACASVTHIGAQPGQAQLGKLVNNGISMTAFLVSCEVAAAAVAAGIQAQKLVAFVNEGRGRNSGTVTKLPQYVLKRSFKLGATLQSALKDQDLYLDEYRGTGLPEGVVPGTRQLWAKTTRLLDPDADAATIVRYFEHFTGVEVAAGEGRGEGGSDGRGSSHVEGHIEGRVETSGDKSAVQERADAQWLELADSAIAFTVLAATCEAAAVGLAGGIAPRVLLSLLNAGTACSYWSERVFAAQVLSRRFDSGTSIGEACSVLRRYLKAAAGTGLPKGLVSRALNVWEEAKSQLAADSDVTAMMQRYERIVGAAFDDTA